jgi:hypothetical protein
VCVCVCVWRGVSEWEGCGVRGVASGLNVWEWEGVRKMRVLPCRNTFSIEQPTSGAADDDVHT